MIGGGGGPKIVLQKNYQDIVIHNLAVSFTCIIAHYVLKENVQGLLEYYFSFWTLSFAPLFKIGVVQIGSVLYMQYAIFECLLCPFPPHINFEHDP